jgi:hypothetical protein
MSGHYQARAYEAALAAEQAAMQQQQQLPVSGIAAADAAAAAPADQAAMKDKPAAAAGLKAPAKASVSDTCVTCYQSPLACYCAVTLAMQIQPIQHSAH